MMHSSDTGTAAARGPSARSHPPLTPRRRPLTLSRIGDYMFVLPAVAFVGLLMLYPLYYNVNLSLYDVNLGNFLSSERPFVGLENYAEALGDPAFWNSLGISLFYTAASITLSFLVGYALALFFDRTFPGGRLMCSLLLVTYVLPTVVSGTIWRWMLQGDAGIVNAVLQSMGLIQEPIFWLLGPTTAMISVIISTVWVTSPFVMILLLAGLQSIPHGVYEAARIDGAGTVKRFWYITAPMMRPVALTVLLLSFIFTFKTFDNIYVMTSGGPGDATKIMPIYAYEKAFGFFEFSDGAVASTVLMLISIVMALAYFWFSRDEEKA